VLLEDALHDVSRLGRQVRFAQSAGGEVGGWRVFVKCEARVV
jgi:hypothetical protein